MMKLGCIRALTERVSLFIRDLVVEGGFLSGGHKEGTWTKGTSPTHQVNASRVVSPTPRHCRDRQSSRIALLPGELPSRDAAGQGM